MEKTEEFVVINGVAWATRNIEKAGEFTDNPGSTGGLFKFNVDFRCSPELAKNADRYREVYDVWHDDMDPSPIGYRVPTKEEFESLFDIHKVKRGMDYQNGVPGCLFTDKENGDKLFLPATNYFQLNGDYATEDKNVYYAVGNYWTCNSVRSSYSLGRSELIAYKLHFEGHADFHPGTEGSRVLFLKADCTEYRCCELPIRCVIDSDAQFRIIETYMNHIKKNNLI
jgi:hypothetical protein